MGLSVVRDLREVRAAAGRRRSSGSRPTCSQGLYSPVARPACRTTRFARMSATWSKVRTWLGKPLWDMLPADADSYFGTVLRAVPIPTRLARAQALKTPISSFLEPLWHKIEIHNLTGRVVECPIDEINRRPRPAPPGRRVRTRRDHSNPILRSRATDHPPNPSRGTRSTGLSTNPRINSPQIH